MDAKKLASLLRGGPGGPLVIDSRSFVEYNRWHVLSSVNICCSKLVKRRLQQGKVTISELVQPAVRGQVPGTGLTAPRPPRLGPGGPGQPPPPPGASLPGEAHVTPSPRPHLSPHHHQSLPTLSPRTQDEALSPGCVGPREGR